MSLPPFEPSGALPVGVHTATLGEVSATLGDLTPHRQVLWRRLERIYNLVRATGHLHRFVVFGSFVTEKPVPNDVDVFIFMDDHFDVDDHAGLQRMVFNRQLAQRYFGATILWTRRSLALGGETGVIDSVQTARDGSKRGVVEVILEEAGNDSDG